MTEKTIDKEKQEGYKQLFEDIKSLLQKGLSKAYQAVDNIKVQTYWQIGERIIREELQHKDRASYGEEIIRTLSKDLKISKRLLFDIVRFCKVYPIVHTLYAQLSWSQS